MFNKKGFTLIELLVVIAVIAVLAVAVLSSINPIEQLNKAKDTGSKSDASEMLNGMERYFATFGCYPWEATGTSPNKRCPTPYNYSQLATMAIGSAAGQSLMQELVDKSEIKIQLLTRLSTQTALASTNVLAVTSDTNQLVHLCFIPASKTFLAQATGDVAGGTGTTHVCVP